MTASDYAELKNAIDAVGFYQSGVITITGNIVFDGQITLTQGKKITLVSDADKCGTACRLGYATRSRYSLFNIVEDSSLTIGGGTDETDRFSFVDEKDGRLAQVGSYAGGKGTVTINGGTYSNNGSARNTTGDGNVAFVFANGNLTINGGTFSNNLAFPAAGALPTIGVSRSGGAVVRSSGTVTVNGGTFDGNTAGANTANNRTFHGGGAIWSDGNLTINGGTFSDNVSNAQHVMSGDWVKNKYPTGGGAIWARNRLTVNGGTFSGNWQKDRNGEINGNRQYYATGGGAIYFGDGSLDDSGDHDVNGILTVNGGVFDGNRSMQDGGAIFVAWNSKVVLRQGEFRNNWANRLGGAIYTEADTESHVTSAAAWSNKAGHFGGGMWLCPSGVMEDSGNGGLALFGNEASTKYDADENGDGDFPKNHLDGKTYTNTSSAKYDAAGDDFAIMYPNMSGVDTNGFTLTGEWFTGGSTSWYADGEPSGNATGYLYGRSDLQTTSTSRYRNGQKPYSTDDGRIVIRQTKDEGDSTNHHGYAFKSIPSDSTAGEKAANTAGVKFHDNTARLSGGALGINGIISFTRTHEVKWNKVDGEDSGRKLSGSKWLLAADEDSGPISADSGDVSDCTVDDSGSIALNGDAWCRIPDDATDDDFADLKGRYAALIEDNGPLDKDDADGRFRVGGLRAGAYRLREYQAPAGYSRSERTYTFTVDTADDPAIIGEGVENDYDIPNDRLRNGAVTWSKFDDKGTAAGNLLSGAEWTLTKIQDYGQDTEIASKDQRSWRVTDCVKGEGDCPAASDGRVADQAGEGGWFRLENLEWGTYRLVEAKAPDGYRLPDAAKVYYTFTIDADHLDVSRLSASDDAREYLKTDNGIKNDRLGAGNVQAAPAGDLARTGVTAGGILSAMLAVGGLGMGLLTRRRRAERMHGAHVGG